MNARHQEGSPIVAAMPPPSRRRRRKSTPIITLFFWLLVIALAAAGYIYGKRIWPSLFEDQSAPKTAEHTVSVTCDLCSGRKRCTTCRGSGEAKGLQDNRKKQTLGTMKCRTCKGTRKCWKCKGTGSIQQKMH